MSNSIKESRVPLLCFAVSTLLMASPSGSGPPVLHRCWSCVLLLPAPRGCFEDRPCWLTRGWAVGPRSHTAGRRATSPLTLRGRYYLGGWLSLDPIKKNEQGSEEEGPSYPKLQRYSCCRVPWDQVLSFLTRRSWLEKSTCKCTHFTGLKIKVRVWTMKIKHSAISKNLMIFALRSD